MSSLRTVLYKLLGGFCITAALVVALYIPTNHTQRAHAQSVTVVGGNGTIQESLTAAATSITAGLSQALNLKEFVMDPIANGLAKSIVQSLTQSIVNWINSGFQGSPAFVTDLRAHLLGQLDQAVGQLIYNDPSLNFLCSPFQLDVKVALATSYREATRESLSEAQCTLSDVSNNIEGFLNGSFNDGGWQSWFELTQKPANTPTGARLAAEGEMYARLIDEEGKTVKELDWGSGFLSFKVCADTDNQKNCDITTPGRVIADQLNKALGAGQDALITADEIQEIISALFAQLAKQALSGVNGLLGLGGSSYSSNTFGANGDSSYLDALRDEPTSINGVTNPFIDAIDRENENIRLQNQVINRIDAVEAQLNSAISQYSGCINLSLPTELASARTTAYATIAANYTHITTLTDMSNELISTTDAQQQLDLVTQYNQMLQNGSVTGLMDNTNLEIYIRYELTDAISDFSNRISTAVRRCNGGGGGNN